MESDLTRDQLEFLEKHDIPLAKVFDATGMWPRHYGPRMEAGGYIVAYGMISKCEKPGHWFKDRHGHCVQCHTQNLSYIKRHRTPGFVYLAESKTTGLIKIGGSVNPSLREEHLNSYKYGGARDWRVIESHHTENYAKRENQIQKILTPYKVTGVYYYDHRGQRSCNELFSCPIQTAQDALAHVLGKPAQNRETPQQLRDDVAMPRKSVAQFATDLKMPAPVLLEQLQKAGVVQSKADDLLSEQDKSKLLEYLRRSHGGAESKTKITLTRKETSKIRAQDSHGKSRIVQAEVRKKRVLVKRDPAELRAEALAAGVSHALHLPVSIEQIIQTMICGKHPITQQDISPDSPWRNASIIEMLQTALASAKSLQNLDKLGEKNATRLDLDGLRQSIREDRNHRVCCACHTAVSRNHLTLSGDNALFVFCDHHCFDTALRNVIQLCGWATAFESDPDDAYAFCSVCHLPIKRADFEHLSFVLHNQKFTETSEVAILCKECGVEFQRRWDERRL